MGRLPILSHPSLLAPHQGGPGFRVPSPLDLTHPCHLLGRKSETRSRLDGAVAVVAIPKHSVEYCHSATAKPASSTVARHPCNCYDVFFLLGFGQPESEEDAQPCRRRGSRGSSA